MFQVKLGLKGSPNFQLRADFTDLIDALLMVNRWESIAPENTATVLMAI